MKYVVKFMHNSYIFCRENCTLSAFCDTFDGFLSHNTLIKDKNGRFVSINDNLYKVW